MTATERIRAAIKAEIQRSPAPPTTEDIAAAVCEALADEVVPSLTDPRLATVRSKILAIAADLRGEVRDA